MSKKRPWIISFEPYEWPSHGQILPPLIKTLSQLPARVLRTKLEPKIVADRYYKEIKATCSRLIFVPPMVDAFSFVHTLRRGYGIDLASIFLETSHVAGGSFPFISYRLTFRDEDQFVTVSPPERELLQGLFPTHKGIHEIPFTIPKPQEVAYLKLLKLRREFRLSPGEQLILYAGRLTPQKNIHVLLEAFRKVLIRRPRARLLLAGDFADEYHPMRGILKGDKYRRQIEAQIRKEFPRDRVFLLGHMPHAKVLRLLQAVDVQVSLSTFFREEFGFSIGEGLTCGLPTVVSEWGGGVGFVKGVAAIGVPVHLSEEGPTPDVDGAEQAIIEALNRSDVFRQKALHFSEKNLTEPAVLKAWKTLLKSTPGRVNIGGPPLPMDSAYFSVFMEALANNDVPSRTENHSEYLRKRPMFRGIQDPYFQNVFNHYRGILEPPTGNRDV